MYLARHCKPTPTALDRLFDGFLSDWPFVPTTKSEFLPPLDVSETDEEFRLRLELAGVAPGDVEVALDEGVLTIRGEKKGVSEGEGETHRRVERRYGQFSRSVRLPAAIDAGDVKATFKDGVLTVVLPKRAEARPRTIEVQVTD